MKIFRGHLKLQDKAKHLPKLISKASTTALKNGNPYSKISPFIIPKKLRAK